MAIYVDTQILKANPNGTLLEREYAKGLQKVNTLFERFRIDGHDSSYIQLVRASTERVRSMTSHRTKRLPTIALPVVIPYNNDEIGSTVIRYSTRPPILSSTGNLSFPTKWIEFREYLTISDSQKDLAWFLIFASNLTAKGVFKLVDIRAEYEGSYNEIIIKKNVMDALTDGSGKSHETLVRHIAGIFMGSGAVHGEPIELAVKIVNQCEADKSWDAVWKKITEFTSTQVLSKESVSEVEYDGEPVTMMKCPLNLKHQDLKEEASGLGIKITVPPQTKDMLYSLIQHIKNKQLVENE